MGINTVVAMDEVIGGSAFEVRKSDNHKGVFAREDITRGSIILYLKGTFSSKPSKYTIQLDNERHLNSPPSSSTDDPDYCWVYLNHSCEPSSYINASELTLRALRDIAPGEEITFNYLTTEFEMATPFNCICESPNCFGLIQGRKFLTPAEADRLSL